MSQIKEIINQLKIQIKNVQSTTRFSTPIDILGVTKYTTPDVIRVLHESGIHQIGENKVQDAEIKINALSDLSLEWHMIGHLQTNKVKKAVSNFSTIQSVDSLKVLRKINNECEKQDKIMPVFIQLNLTGESQKYGFKKDEFEEQFREILSFPRTIISGIMAMGPNTDDKDLIRTCFKANRKLFEECQKSEPTISHLSMGMSQDFEIAIEEGATMVRLGSILINNVVKT